MVIHTLIIPFYKYENRCEYHLAQLKPTLVRLYMILLFVVFLLCLEKVFVYGFFLFPLPINSILKI